MAEKGRTWGKKQVSVFANVPYYKPVLRKIVIRYPGVLRRSDKVLAVNKALEDLRNSSSHPSKQCSYDALKAAGIPSPTWHDRIKCLREKMRAVIPGGK